MPKFDWVQIKTTKWILRKDFGYVDKLKELELLPLFLVKEMHDLSKIKVKLDAKTFCHDEISDI